jgi:hypothetical protein
MDINLLVQRLKHGDSYLAHNAEGDPYQVNNPPNSLMIKAANVILHLDQLLQQNNAVTLNLQKQINDLTEQYETLRNSSVITTPSGET